MAIDLDRIVTLDLKSSPPLPPRPVALSNTSNQIIIEQEPIFLLELRFSYKFDRYRRNSNGDWRNESIPTASSSSYLIEIHPCCLFDPSTTPYIHFLYGFLYNFNLSASSRFTSANKIVSFLVSLANDQRFLGFAAVAVAEVETISGQVIVEEEFLNTDEGYLAEPPSRIGVSRSVIRRLKKEGKFHGAESWGSGDCVICLEKLSSAVKAMIKLPCDHFFHEQCILKWLKDQNSCPICRSEVKD